VAPSQRLRRDKVEDGQVDVRGCVGSYYTYFTVFYVLGPRGIVLFKSLTWTYKSDPKGMELLVTYLVLFCIP
jgi:hypothetical protein